MCGIHNNYGSASEFDKAQHDFKESREATRHAAEHFAKAQEETLAAGVDFARGNILGALGHSAEAQRQFAEGREDLDEAREAREHAFEHIVNGMEDQALEDIGLGGLLGGFGGLGSIGGGFYGGLGPNIDPGFNPWSGGVGPHIDPGFNPWGGGFDGARFDPGFIPASKLIPL